MALPLYQTPEKRHVSRVPLSSFDKQISVISRYLVRIICNVAYFSLEVKRLFGNHQSYFILSICMAHKSPAMKAIFSALLT